MDGFLGNCLKDLLALVEISKKEKEMEQHRRNEMTEELVAARGLADMGNPSLPPGEPSTEVGDAADEEEPREEGDAADEEKTRDRLRSRGNHLYRTIKRELVVLNSEVSQKPPIKSRAATLIKDVNEYEKSAEKVSTIPPLPLHPSLQTHTHAHNHKSFLAQNTLRQETNVSHFPMAIATATTA